MHFKVSNNGFTLILILNSMTTLSAYIHIISLMCIFPILCSKPYLFITSVVVYVIFIILKLIMSSERYIYPVKKEPNPYKRKVLAVDVYDTLYCKYVVFLILGYLFLFISWYCVSAFCAVYRNTQWVLIKYTFISFGISNAYPIIIDLLPALMRLISLENGDQKTLYEASKALSYL